MFLPWGLLLPDNAAACCCCWLHRMLDMKTSSNKGNCTCSAVHCRIHCIALQCNAVQCSAMQCNAVQCNAVQCSAVQCHTVIRRPMPLLTCPLPHCSSHQFQLLNGLMGGEGGRNYIGMYRQNCIGI